MKKQDLKNLILNKKVISNFDQKKLTGKGLQTVDHKTGCIDQCDLK
ncbi:hypothetical protein [uncultured Lacinutrix sp.]|nr:hypothetical protein [uncultured Lacinutrix sp.]